MLLEFTDLNGVSLQDLTVTLYTQKEKVELKHKAHRYPDETHQFKRECYANIERLTSGGNEYLFDTYYRSGKQFEDHTFDA